MIHLLFLVACQQDPSPGPLLAAAAIVDFTPEGFETFLDCGEDGLCEGDPGWSWPDEGEGDATYDDFEAFEDCGLDRLCEGDEGWPGPDEGEGDGEFQALYLAGFQGSIGSTYGGRPAQGVHDPVTARLLLLRQDDEQVLLVLVDAVGLFHKYTWALRREIAAASDIPADRVVVAALHDHQGPDTMGLWSPRGVSQDFIRPVVDATIEAAAALPAQLVEVSATWARAETPACQGDDGALLPLADCPEPASEAEAKTAQGWTPVMLTDTRDPYVRATDLAALRFDGASGTVATLVSWTNHPEVLGDENGLVSADFPHYVREQLEARYGGVALYASGPVGGMMTPLRGTAVPLWAEDGSGRVEGELVSEAGFDKAWSTGFEVAQAAIDALAPETPGAGLLDVSSATVRVPLRLEYQILFGLTETYDPADDATTTEGEGCESGCVEADLWRIDLDGLTLVTAPGEAFPELVVGRGAVTVDYADEGYPAVDYPGIRGLRAAAGHDDLFLLGLADNELGYLVPGPDFLDDDDHPNFYEESVSAHETAGDVVCEALIDLLDAEGPCLD